MSGVLDIDYDRIEKIFFPFMHSRKEVITQNNTRFVHYTTAESAMKILLTQEFWMRQSTSMKDYTEAAHGLSCILKAYNESDIGKEFKNILNNLFEDITEDIQKYFNSWLPHIKTETYLACVSEHKDYEDKIGRLSMWRAYGSTTGVALVLNNKPFLEEDGPLNVYTSAVEYLDEKSFEIKLAELTKGISLDYNYIKSLNRETVTHVIFNALRFAVYSTKHPGFGEEQEWRVIYSPTYEESPQIKKNIEIIRGIPQTVYKIPLKNLPEGEGVKLSELLDRVIIGPTEYSFSIWKAFVSVLKDLGINNPEQKVVMSDIPEILS